jgi:alpha-beta hydrolase superfamily lysophospholipase
MQEVAVNHAIGPTPPAIPSLLARPAAGPVLPAKASATAPGDQVAVAASRGTAPVALNVPRSGTLKASDGAPIPYRVTMPNGPVKAVAVMQMGTLGQPEYFDQMAAKLAAAGIASYAVGARSSAPDHRQHAGDLDAVVKLAQQEQPKAPLRVMGVSLGAMIALDWSATKNPSQVPVAAMAPVVVPTFLKARDIGRIAHGLVSEKAAQKAVNTPMSAGRALTTNPASPEAVLSHPETMTVPADLFGDVVKMAGATALKGHQMKGRLLVAIAGEDEVSWGAATRGFAATIRSQDKTVQTFPGLAHDMSQEAHDPVFVKALTDWLLKP